LRAGATTAASLFGSAASSHVEAIARDELFAEELHWNHEVLHLGGLGTQEHLFVPRVDHRVTEPRIAMRNQRSRFDFL
jgi:hypothetical protein